MTVVTQSLDLYRAFRESDAERAERRLALAQESARESLDLMHEFAKELRLSETSEGLKIALENLMRISVPEGVYYEVSVEGEEKHLPDYVRDQLYLILREGVRNVIAHADAENMEVEVGIAPGEVRATILDAGMGFTSEGTVLEDGLGICSMRERAELLGGSFEFSSVPEGGTRIEVRIPLPWRRREEPL
jgi:signal transduction histidine kinase